jgi:RNA polymerase sigma factor (sigma-70 family)
VGQIEESELRQLVDQWGPSLVLFARQWSSTPDDALQEALIELVQLVDVPLHLKAWLFRVVKNKALNHLRSERRRDMHQRSAVMERDEWFVVDHETRLDGRHIASLLETLDAAQREIVVSRIWGDLTYEEIATLVNRPIATVHRLYQSALVLFL